METSQLLIDEVVSAAGKKAAYAIERHIPQVLRDIRSQQQMALFDNGNADKVEMTLKMTIEHPVPHKATVEVSSVSWVRSFRRKYEGFLPEEIDIKSPMLPLEMPTAEAEKTPGYETPEEENLVKAAHELKKDVYRPARPSAGAHWRRIVERWAVGEDGWKSSLCEDEAQASEALCAASDMGHMVLWGVYGSLRGERCKDGEGWFGDAVICDLLKAGYRICNNEEGYEYKLDGTVDTDEIKPKYADYRAYLNGGGLPGEAYPETGDATDALLTMPRFREWHHRHNAEKMIKKGLKVCYVYFDMNEEQNCLYTHDGKEWGAVIFTTYDKALRVQEKLEKEGYFNPEIHPGNLEALLGQGFQIIGNEKKYPAGKKTHAIFSVDAKDSRTNIAQFTNTDDYLDAWHDAIENADILER
jgi:hypothetical protein